MPSLVSELNNLLEMERGEAEAIKVLIDQHRATDPDITDGAQDVLETATWSCSGLYHRITQLHGTPTLDRTDMAARVGDIADLKDKIEMICRGHRKDMSRIRSLQQRDDVDPDTESFLTDLHKAHAETVEWCVSTLKQWERELP